MSDFHASMRIGMTAEKAVSFALSPYCTTVPAHIGEDQGFDLICSLLKEVKIDDRVILRPFNAFYVQVKCKDSEKRKSKKIIYEGDNLTWLMNLDLPFIIALVYLKENPRIEIFNTADRFPVLYKDDLRKQKVVFTTAPPDDPNNPYDYIKGVIHLTNPIVISLKEYGQRQDNVFNALEKMVKDEIINLSWLKNKFKIYINKDGTGSLYFTRTKSMDVEMQEKLKSIVNIFFCHCFPKGEQDINDETKMLFYSFMNIAHVLNYSDFGGFGQAYKEHKDKGENDGLIKPTFKALLSFI